MESIYLYIFKTIRSAKDISKQIIFSFHWEKINEGFLSCFFDITILYYYNFAV